MSNRINVARRERGWSQTRLISELERVARRRSIQLPTRETMKSRVSRWENNHSKPDEFYRELLREVLGLDDRELGFEEPSMNPITSAADDLRFKLDAANTANVGLVESLCAQTEAIREQDRQYGAGRLLEQMRRHVHNIEHHLTHALFESTRRPLAEALADAASLAGWQALDLAALDQAWRCFETAGSAALQGHDPALYAFARLEQAHVLVDLEHRAAAADLAAEVWSESRNKSQAGMRCWLATATAEMYAEAGKTKQALKFLALGQKAAEGLGDDLPPYLVFDKVHLQRWTGHILVLLGDPAAEDMLHRAAADMDETFVRASASLHIDLAQSLHARDEREGASAQLETAEALARRTGSRRQLARVQRLRLAS